LGVEITEVANDVLSLYDQAGELRSGKCSKGHQPLKEQPPILNAKADVKPRSLQVLGAAQSRRGLVAKTLASEKLLLIHPGE
jgi:hypothetical protein